MRLHQAIIENEVVPGAGRHSTMLFDLTLKEIVAAGKVTNAYQLFALCHVSQVFKSGQQLDLTLGTVPLSDDATSTETKEAMKSLSDSEHVKLATYLLDCITTRQCLFYNTEASMQQWVNFVLQKQ